MFFFNFFFTKHISLSVYDLSVSTLTSTIGWTDRVNTERLDYQNSALILSMPLVIVHSLMQFFCFIYFLQGQKVPYDIFVMWWFLSWHQSFGYVLSGHVQPVYGGEWGRWGDSARSDQRWTEARFRFRIHWTGEYKLSQLNRQKREMNSCFLQNISQKYIIVLLTLILGHHWSIISNIIYQHIVQM